MERMAWLDWFQLSVPFWELIVRGSVMYWFLFVLFRFVVRRGMGSVGLADILLLVIVADASQNALSGSYTSVTDGMILISVLVGWDYLLNWISFHVPALRRFTEPPPVTLIRDGRLLHRNLRMEYLTEEELRAKLREQGVESIRSVKDMRIEPNGKISVIRYRK